MRRPWCQEELETADLGDQRLNQRFEQILESLSLRPTASIPAALGGRTELEARRQPGVDVEPLRQTDRMLLRVAFQTALTPVRV